MCVQITVARRPLLGSSAGRRPNGDATGGTEVVGDRALQGRRRGCSSLSSAPTLTMCDHIEQRTGQAQAQASRGPMRCLERIRGCHCWGRVARCVVLVPVGLQGPTKDARALYALDCVPCRAHAATARCVGRKPPPPRSRSGSSGSKFAHSRRPRAVNIFEQGSGSDAAIGQSYEWRDVLSWMRFVIGRGGGGCREGGTTARQ